MATQAFGTTSIGKPADAIAVPVGTDLQSLVDISPAGSTFWIEAGVHRMQSVVPKDNDSFIGQKGAVLNGARLITDFDKDGANWVASGQTQEGERRATDQGAPGAERAGYPETFFIDDKPLKPVDSLDKVAPGTFYFDYAADKIYFQDDPSGHKVEAGVSPFAFRGPATGVTVENLVVEKYDSPTQYGAVGYDNSAKGWTVQNNEIKLNYGVGAYVGTDSKVVGNDVHDNGQLGLGGNGDNILVQDNAIAHNGHFSGISPGWEAGGTKFSQTDNLKVVGNDAHDNNGYGLWTDIDNIHTLYDGNTVTGNSAGGISHEISYDATIRNNVLSGNGADSAHWLWGGAIQVQNSKNVDVSGNHVDTTSGGNGITLIQQDRGSGEYGPHTTTGNTVHDNVIVDGASGAGGVSGSVADYDSATLQNGGNSFTDNTYHIADPSGQHWAWTDAYYNWDGFRQGAGQDAGSTLSTSIPTPESLPAASATVASPAATAQVETAAVTQPAAAALTAATDPAASPTTDPAPQAAATVAPQPASTSEAQPASEATAPATAGAEPAPAADPVTPHQTWADLFAGHGGDGSPFGAPGHGTVDWSAVANVLQHYADLANHTGAAQTAQGADLPETQPLQHACGGSHAGLTL